MLYFLLHHIVCPLRSSTIFTLTKDPADEWQVLEQNFTATISISHRRKRRRLVHEIVREQTTSHFYPSIQETTSNLLLNLLRTPEDFLAHITMCIFLHKHHEKRQFKIMHAVARSRRPREWGRALQRWADFTPFLARYDREIDTWRRDMGEKTLLPCGVSVV
jgi:hypothetical protein